MKKFCTYGIGIAVAVILYVWFMIDVIPGRMTPFGQINPADIDSGAVKVMLTIFPFVIAALAAAIGHLVGLIVYRFYSFIYYLARSWVNRVESKAAKPTKLATR